MGQKEKTKREFYVYRVTNQNEENNKPVKEEKTINNSNLVNQPNTSGSPIIPRIKTSNESIIVSNQNTINSDPDNKITFDDVDPFSIKTNDTINRFNDVDPFEILTPQRQVELNDTPDPFENRYPKMPETRGEYVYSTEEESGSIEDLPEDIFDDRYDVVSEIDTEEPVAPQEPKVVKRQIEIEKPKVSTNLIEVEEPVVTQEPKVVETPSKPTIETISQKRSPVVDIQAPKITKYIPFKLDLLTKGGTDDGDDRAEAERQKEVINQTLKDSGIKAQVDNYIFGPTVTQFMIKVAPGVNVNTIKNCEANLAMYLEVERILIQTPIPGKPYAGIEVPKKKEFRHTVHLGDILDSPKYKSNKCKLPIVIGRDNYGEPTICDITEMPHCLIAGTTKSGKSVCLNTIIISLLYKFNPNELRLVLMDPKRIELSPYEGIPHLAMPVITDKSDFPAAIGWVYEEMERRYEIFQSYGERSFGALNNRLAANKKAKLPYIVTIIDEFGDWFAGLDDEVAEQIQKIAAKARAAGIHVILATQRPTAESISGNIKANFDTRIAFKVTNFVDSKVILDKGGAEKLEGYGDMLIKYAGQTERRLQGAFVDDNDIYEIIRFLQDNNKCNYIVTLEEIRQSATSRQLAGNSSARSNGINDDRFAEVAYYIVRNKNASNNSLTREFSMGFNRVNDILVALEQLGVLSQAVKGKQREVLVNEMELQQILTNNNIF